MNLIAIMRNIDIDDFIISPSPCDCASSSYRYQAHGHVIVGNFSIILDGDLRQLSGKRQNYREQTSANWLIKLIFIVTEDCAKRWAKKEG